MCLQATLYNDSGRGWPHCPHSFIARHGAMQINTETVESATCATLGVASASHMLVRCWHTPRIHRPQYTCLDKSSRCSDGTGCCEWPLGHSIGQRGAQWHKVCSGMLVVFWPVLAVGCAPFEVGGTRLVVSTSVCTMDVNIGCCYLSLQISSDL